MHKIVTFFNQKNEKLYIFLCVKAENQDGHFNPLVNLNLKL